LTKAKKTNPKSSTWNFPSKSIPEKPLFRTKTKQRPAKSREKSPNITQESSKRQGPDLAPIPKTKTQ
jgi:hypothetical protein